MRTNMSNSEALSAFRTGAPSVPVPPMRATLVTAMMCFQTYFQVKVGREMLNVHVLYGHVYSTDGSVSIVGQESFKFGPATSA